MTYEPLAGTFKDFNLNSAQIDRLRRALKAEYERGKLDGWEFATGTRGMPKTSVKIGGKTHPDAQKLGQGVGIPTKLKSNKED